MALPTKDDFEWDDILGWKLKRPLTEYVDNIVLSPEEFDRVVSDLENPSPPTESIKRGAELIRKLYGRERATK